MTEQERRTLRAKIRSLQERGSRSRTRWIPIALVVIVVQRERPEHLEVRAGTIDSLR